MDVEKILTFAATYLSRYVSAFVATLIRPSLLFTPVIEPVETSLLGTSRSDADTRINPELFTFALLSFIVGFELRSVGPARDQLPLHVAALVVMVVWLTFAALLHLGAKLLGGRASFVETATVTLQVLAVVYVLCNVVAFVVRVSGKFSGADARVIDRDIAAYALAQALLLSIYVPLAVGAVHRIPGVGLVAIVVAAWVLLFVAASRTLHRVADAPASNAWIEPTRWGEIIEPAPPPPVPTRPLSTAQIVGSGSTTDTRDVVILAPHYVAPRVVVLPNRRRPGQTFKLAFQSVSIGSETITLHYRENDGLLKIAALTNAKGDRTSAFVLEGTDGQYKALLTRVEPEFVILDVQPLDK